MIVFLRKITYIISFSDLIRIKTTLRLLRIHLTSVNLNKLQPPCRIVFELFRNRMTENGTICPCGVFPQFIVIVSSNLANLVMGDNGQLRVQNALYRRKLNLETFLAGALYREIREFMRILTTFLGKTHRNPS